MLLLSIVLVGVFFVFELREIFTLTILLLLSFWGTIVLGNINLFDKALNIIVSLVLSTLLLFCARYNYYFKSKHFIKIKQLQQKNDEIEALSRQKNEVLAYVAHDLRSPLVNIQMLNDMILAAQPDLQEAQLIKQCTQQSANIINDLLDALKHNNANLELQTVELNSFMQRLVDKWKESTNRQINLYMPSMALFVNINPSKMERVLDNLVQNADKFSAKDKPIDIVLNETNGQSIGISVKDYGIGIPDNLKQHIFEQFTAAGRKGLRGEKSIGIGLHISKKIVEQHQGNLSIESEENVGTSFTVHLAIATSLS